MPSIQEIEQFKQVLNELGSEREVLAERSEQIEDIPPPEEGLSDDLRELLQGFGTEDAAGEGGGPVAGPSAEPALDPWQASEGGGRAGGGAEPEPALPDLDFASLFGEPPAEGAAPEAPRAGASGAEEGGEAEAEAEGPSEAEEELPDEFDLLKLTDADFGELSGAEPAESGGGTGEGDAPAVDGLAAAPEAAGGGDDGPPGLDIPGLEDLDEDAVDSEVGGAKAGGGEGPEADIFGAEGPDAFALEETLAEEDLPEAEAGGEGAAPGPFGTEEPLPPLEDFMMDEITMDPESPPEMPGGLGEETAATPGAAGPPSGAAGHGGGRRGGGRRAFGTDAIDSEVGGTEAGGEDAFGAEGGGGVGGGADLFGVDDLATPFFDAEGGVSGAGGEPAEDDGAEADGLASEGGEEYTLDDFSLPGGEEMAGPAEPEEEMAADEEAGLFPGLPRQDARPQAPPAAERELSLSEEEFSRLQRTLESLPRNLKIAVEELIGEKGLAGAGLHELVGCLVGGAAPSVVARQYARLTGRRIALPAGFEKRTGLAFEAERRSFAYAFRHNILPIVGRFVLGAALLSVLSYAGYRFVYQPVHALLLYNQGYKLLEGGSYPSANRSFERASGIHPMKGQYFRYADGFIGARQFPLAEEKYEQALKRYGPYDRRTLLAYAGLEIEHLADYPKAIDFLDTLIHGVEGPGGGMEFKGDFRDYEALLLRGDAWLAWAEEESDYYEKAHFDYTQLLGYYGRREEVMFRLLRVFIRTDRLDETLKLKGELESRRGLKVDADAYAELGGYLLDKKLFEQVERTLLRALEADRSLPEVNYQLARWFNRLGEAGKEEQALRSVLARLAETGTGSRRRQVMLIDAHTRLGRLFWGRRQYLEAQEQLTTAIGLIESGQKLAGLGPNRLFGEAYRSLGDIYYYVDRNWESALSQYQSALDNQLQSPEMVYRMGVIDYLGGRFEQALPRLAEAAEGLPQNLNVLYALANTLCQLGHYSSAEGYYLQLLSLLEAQRGRVRNLQPQVDPEHRALLDNTMRVYNNLGVTLGRLMEQSGDRRRFARALANLTFSSEHHDLLNRESATLVRGDTRNLAYLNQRGMLYPQEGFELQLYNPLPLDTEAVGFSGETARR